MVRDTITGTYDRSLLAALRLPIAWSGTMGEAARTAEEKALADLVAEALSALDTSPDAAAVEIVNGHVTATIHADG